MIKEKKFTEGVENSEDKSEGFDPLKQLFK